MKVRHEQAAVVLTDDKGNDTRLELDEAVELAQTILDACGHIDPDG